ncbi:MAG: GAF domain-containing protein, partial [Candidatus Rokubacteria bacterium]|nr:GAF domain-containing protein [Candidatus Rokubacteria bacterium]
PRGFPFRSELSLAPLVAFWEQAFGDHDSVKGAFARMVRAEVEKAPELLRPITDLAVIERHRKLVDVLMAAVFPPALFDQEYAAALVPFQLRAFYATPPFRRLLMAPDGALRGRMSLAPSIVAALRFAFATRLVLERVYGKKVDADYELVFTVPDPDTGLDRHFRMQFDWRFVDVETLGDPPPLSGDAAEILHAGFRDPGAMRAVLPADRFVLRGLTIFRALEVTDHEVLSALKRDLIDKESITSSARFQGLEDKLRTLFRRPRLCLGLAALDGDRVLVLSHGARFEQSCIFADSKHLAIADFTGSVYERAVRGGQPLLVGDLAAAPDRTAVEDAVASSGVRTLLVAPLHYQDKVIGTLELASPEPDDVSPIQLPKLAAVLPLFSMAVQRSMEELNARVQALIKEKCTAIHPVVEWRFRKAVLESLEHRAPDATGAVEIESIVFPDVYPLYALADIRGSSTQRSLAIQADLLAQLGLARGVIAAAAAARRLPALDELLYRIDKAIAQIEAGLRSGDEVAIIAFLRGDVERLFARLVEFGPAVVDRVTAYRAALDPRLGAVYDRRRLFEESVTRLADTVSAYLDLEQQAAQAMFPHYFEKQKTDGVDYQIYVGGALLEDGRFDPLYLKSLRLWQLMVTCGIALRAHQLRDRLPVPLETTHLVLVQHAPLSIRFRFDEKRFDVDGAYDIRYEIVKKRIDKAVIKGTTERVTQPGRIAIVYAQPGEAQEYRGYLEYLHSLVYVGRGVEDGRFDPLYLK